MRSYLALATIAVLLATSKAGQLLSAYNLISTPHLVVPQTLSNVAVPGIIPAHQSQENLAHPAVIENAAAESHLPDELLNPFYKNPAIAEGLARESWFIENEFPVHNREADKISRNEIYKIVKRIQSVRRR